MFRSLVAAVAAVLISAPLASAQDMQPTWFTIYADHVEISNQKEFEEVSREFVRMFEDKDLQDVSWVTIQGPDIGYTYAIPGMGPADMAEMNASWGAAMTALGGAGEALGARSNALVDTQEMYYLLLRPDLSYRPETVGFSAAEPYRHYTQLRVHPGKAEALEAAAKAWAAAYGKHDVQRGYRVYQYITGSDLPMYLIVEHARDPAHYETVSAQIRNTLGSEREALLAQTGPVLRSARDLSGWVRPDLSYPALPGGN